MKRNMLAVLALATILCSIPALSQGTMFINLQTGTWVRLGPTPGVLNPTITPSPNPDCVGWYEATVNINLKPLPTDGKARTAYITAEYDGTPIGWTVDIGDSRTNDGYGGNGGGPEHAAEVQVANQTLSVYNDPKIPGQVDLLLSKEMSLTNGSLHFAIADQALSIGSPREILATPVTKTLFAIPDADAATEAEKWSVHAAFNRVVNGDYRNGCGVRSVAISTGEDGV